MFEKIIEAIKVMENVQQDDVTVFYERKNNETSAELSGSPINITSSICHITKEFIDGVRVAGGDEAAEILKNTILKAIKDLA